MSPLPAHLQALNRTVHGRVLCRERAGIFHPALPPEARSVAVPGALMLAFPLPEDLQRTLRLVIGASSLHCDQTSRHLAERLRRPRRGKRQPLPRTAQHRAPALFAQPSLSASSCSTYKPLQREPVRVWLRPVGELPRCRAEQSGDEHQPCLCSWLTARVLAIWSLVARAIREPFESSISVCDQTPRDNLESLRPDSTG